ncbi:MAG: hypothetical protein AMXMBFR84_26440 [Candidatus Hydrogenedentota bacterium]
MKPSGLTIAEAVRISIENSGMSVAETIAAIHVATGYADHTIRQWQDSPTTGKPIRDIPAVSVAAFCEATGSTLVADVIAHQVEKAKARAAQSTSIHTLCTRTAELMETVAASAEDGVADEDELKQIELDVLRMADALASIRSRRVRKTEEARRVNARAASLSDAHKRGLQ